ncbi:MAG TPA: hypothetical protein PLU56_02400 [Sphingorhabdus lacus]|jgi:uncharacterized protein YlxW (UPF0749 family)|nr:hypothetical protein [Sphingorhabdus lacus]
MSFGGPSFIVAIVMICTAGWIINNWIRAKYGYPLEDEWGGKTALTDGDYPEAERQISLLSNENATLNNKIGNLEERIAVLERIVTDKAGRLSEEIEKLR